MTINPLKRIYYIDFVKEDNLIKEIEILLCHVLNFEFNSKFTIWRSYLATCTNSSVLFWQTENASTLFISLKISHLHVARRRSAIKSRVSLRITLEIIVTCRHAESALTASAARNVHNIVVKHYMSEGKSFLYFKKNQTNRHTIFTRNWNPVQIISIIRFNSLVPFVFGSAPFSDLIGVDLRPF